MAVTRTSQRRTATICVENGTSSSGTTLSKNINFSGVNADCANDKLYECLEALAGLMDKTVIHLYVTDKDILAEEVSA